MKAISHRGSEHKPLTIRGSDVKRADHGSLRAVLDEQRSAGGADYVA
jgi:hypothetical protein